MHAWLIMEVMVLTGGAVGVHQEPAYPAWVVQGLRVEPAGGMKVRVSAGTADLQGTKVTFKGATFDIDGPAIVVVNDEKTALSDEKPESWNHGTSLRECTCFGNGSGTPLPMCMRPGSLRVKKGPGEAEAYEEGRDYLTDVMWNKVGRVATGKIAQGQEVYLDYEYRLWRIDSLVLSRDGKMRLVRGAGRRTCAKQPEIDDESARLANILVWFDTTDMKPGLIFPCGPPLAEPTDAERAERQKAVARTLAKLKAGQDVTIVTWGDSVTSGGDAQPIEKAFPWAFTNELRAKYPTARIHFVNAGIGGTSLPGRLPNIQAEVLDHHPDLVTIEFVNDCGYPVDQLKPQWQKAIDMIKAAGAEIIVITPHFVMPPWMGKSYDDMWWTDDRACVEAMRQEARDNGLGLADTSKRWEHACREGLPYMTWEWNGINHPDNPGHDLFVRDLMSYF
jgi:hypothetical protein